MRDCDIASVPATDRRVTKPKIYEGALSCRMWPGMLARLEALQDDDRQGDYVRFLLLRAIKQEEAERGIVSPPDPEKAVEFEARRSGIKPD